jgi:N-methylhydantoinase B
MAHVDPITYQVLRARFDGIVREMEKAVFRTGYSTIVRESHDFSCGILDRQGRLVGQSNHATHMAAYPETISGLLQFYGLDDMAPGDAFLSNHPYYSGCPHANDMVVVVPIFHDGAIISFAASMGHTPDIGGVAAGSRNATARDIFGEGLQIMPVRFMREYEILQDTATFVRANSRVPDMMIGDLTAKAGVCFSIGEARVRDALDTYGVETLLQMFEDLGEHTEREAREYISKWQDGVAESETWVDDPSDPERPIRLHVAVIKEGDRLVLDFTATGDQAAAPINLRPPFVRGLAYHAVIAMTDPYMPISHGLAQAIECRFRKGSLIDPEFPGPVGFYSKTVSIVDSVITSAVAKAAGQPAIAHGSTQSSIVIGYAGDSDRQYVQYELMYAGARAWDGGDGFSGVGARASGGRFTSIEIIETEFPVEVTRFEVLPDTGGDGRSRGGPGYVREYRVRADSRLSGGAAKRRASGTDGGDDGENAYVVVHPGTDREETYPGIASNIGLKPGETFRIETGGGGGVLPPRERDRELVIGDLLDGIITPEKARDVYGLTDGEIDAALAD